MSCLLALKLTCVHEQHNASWGDIFEPFSYEVKDTRNLFMMPTLHRMYFLLEIITKLKSSLTNKVLGCVSNDLFTCPVLSPWIFYFFFFFYGNRFYFMIKEAFDDCFEEFNVTYKIPSPPLLSVLGSFKIY